MADEKNIITGQTKSGIKFSIDKRVTDDARLLFYLSELQDESLPMMTKNTSLFELLKIIFGTGDGLKIFLNEVAIHHEGVADAQSLIQELSEMIDILKAKN